ncbi:uncharacterized protein MYCFIDRAFT_179924 [Pseudocercospora fijiensis CIRAD86]|uniref:Uncharacterized protein n=1 Tax=Pseudocercospora fijiensis (strain CIRAD86) TaxID=383855 RepID=M2YHS7_PSEFD|nr:uncharacterized protein MYCFIDRAFT_179924 [Pseudocercospora fijiensis CIRAD86]EME77350.1 hypothetical protein MYCFIDRAFT_179924 [Pseudocercospora fijiensis CIRAD86]
MNVLSCSVNIVHHGHMSDQLSPRLLSNDQGGIIILERDSLLPWEWHGFNVALGKFPKSKGKGKDKSSGGGGGSLIETPLHPSP